MTGSFATYQIKNKKGYKIFKKPFKSKVLALNSANFQKACFEAFFYIYSKKEAKNINIPKCYGIDFIKVNNLYHIALVLEHIEGSFAFDIDFDADLEDLDPKYIKFYKKVKKEFSKIGLNYKDLNDGNILRKKDKLYLIDFSPDVTDLKISDKKLKSYQKDFNKIFEKLKVDKEDYKKIIWLKLHKKVVIK